MIVDTPTKIDAGPDTPAVAPWRWSRVEYLRLAELGFFHNARVERIEGEIYRMSPQSEPHAFVIWRLSKQLDPTGSTDEPTYWIRVHLPLALGDSDPEPDIAVVELTPTTGVRTPSSAQMVVEVSRSSLEFDRTTKQVLYARAGIPEYWIVDVDGRRLEVYRQPNPGPPDGSASYAERIILGPGERIAPLFAPNLELTIDSLFPPSPPQSRADSEVEGA